MPVGLLLPGTCPAAHHKTLVQWWLSEENSIWLLGLSQIQMVYKLLQEVFPQILPDLYCPPHSRSFTALSEGSLSFRIKIFLSITYLLLCQTLSWSRKCRQWPATTAVLMPVIQHCMGRQASQTACPGGAVSVHQGLPWSCFGHQHNFVEGWTQITHLQAAAVHKLGTPQIHLEVVL